MGIKNLWRGLLIVLATALLDSPAFPQSADSFFMLPLQDDAPTSLARIEAIVVACGSHWQSAKGSPYVCWRSAQIKAGST